jgi:acyl carrier protein
MVDSVLRDQIIERLLGVSDAKVAAADIVSSTSLRDDLNLSSLDLIGLAADLEDELGIDIDDDVLSRIRTIGDLFKAIDDTKAGAGPA